MKRLAAALAAASGCLIAAFAACSDSGSSRGDGADAGGDAIADNALSEKDWNVEPAETGPQFNADGWIRLDYPNCNLYAAPSVEKMPAPLAWEPCPSIVTPLGLACQQIRFAWPTPTGGASKSIGVTGGWIDANGKAWLAVGYTPADYVVNVVAEADGPVRQAITYQQGPCIVTKGSIAKGKAVFTVFREGSKTLPRERGAVGGDVDKAPLPLEHWADGAGRSYVAGPNSYFAFGPENAVRSWTSTTPALGSVALTDPGEMAPRRFVGDDLFYELGDQSFGRVKVYSPAKGVRDLVSFGNDVSARAVNFGTDGTDMVWVEAFGRSAVGQPWTTINIVTSPFANDASNLQKRRLRSEVSATAIDPFVVGCGYAAHFISSISEGNIVRVVRLSDGRSWKLPAVYGDASGYLFQTPLALTCDELFVNVNDSGTFNTARIRLDSLGPGEAAD